MRRKSAASVMPTLRGWLLLIVGAALPGIGRYLGIDELYEIGIALVVLVVISMFAVQRRQRRFRIRRTIRPAEWATAGRAIDVEVEITNLDKRPSVPLILAERLDPALGSIRSIRTPALPGGSTTTLSYKVTPPTRGRVTLGPAKLTGIDPFGMAKGTTGAAPQEEVYVYPATERLSSPMPEGGTVAVGAESPSPIPTRAGEDFYAIREFRSGDDLRKIHWKSTARFGEPMVREEERRSEPLISVVIDDSRTDAERFEALVGAAASVIEDASIRRHSFRVLKLSETPPFMEFDRGTAHYRSCMEKLALAKQSDEGDAIELLGHLRADVPSGITVLVTNQLAGGLTAMWPQAEDGGWGVAIVMGDRPQPDVVRSFEASRIAVIHSSTSSVAKAWESRFGSISQPAVAR